MTNNMGSADRVIRPLLAIVFIALYFTGNITGIVGVILLVLAGVFLLTSVVGMCPLYKLLGINSCKVKS